MDYNYLFKLIIVGDATVGKSCILLRFISNNYRNSHDLTIGVEFGMKIININNKNIKLQIWDTAGQECFRSIIRSYYRNSAGAILVYDISNRKSFNNIIYWLEEIKKYASNNLSIILVGNKCDLDEKINNESSNNSNKTILEQNEIELSEIVNDSLTCNKRIVLEREGIELAEKYNLLFIEASAKKLHNIDNIFNILSNNIINKIFSNIDISEYNGIRIGNNIIDSNNNYEYKKCCN